MALNRLRVLSRVRSRHATSSRTRGKTPLRRRLKTATQLLQTTSICSTRAQSLAGDIENLQRQLDHLEDMDSVEARSANSEEHLMRLVKSIHSIFLQYEQDLKLVPYTPGVWSGNATESLIDRLRKISQYVTACEELPRAARRYKVFSNIVINFVNLQQVGKRLSGDIVFDNNMVIDASCTRETLSRISIQRRKSIHDTRESIKARLSETSKLHAEVQLVLYFEQHAVLLRPRVICSNKSACYLCHLFFRVHGQYYIPSTHGKLYDTWKWPVVTPLTNTIGHSEAQLSLQRLLPEFSNAIDQKIRDCLDNARIVRRMEPLESRVDLLAAMTPSILSYISRHSRTVRGEPAHHQEHIDVEAPGTDDIDEQSSTTKTETDMEPAPLSQVPLPQIDTPITRQAVSVEDSVSSDEIATPTMIKHFSRGSSVFSLGSDFITVAHGRRGPGIGELQRGPLCLQEGECSSYSFNMENELLRIHVPGLHVALRYDASPVQGTLLGGQIPQAQKKSLQMEIQCLSSSEYCSNNSLAEIVNLEDGNWAEKSAPEGILFSADGLLLKRKSILLRLRARSA